MTSNHQAPFQPFECPHHGPITEPHSIYGSRCPSCCAIASQVHAKWNASFAAALEGSIKVSSPEHAVDAAIRAADAAAKRELLEQLIKGRGTFPDALDLNGAHYDGWDALKQKLNRLIP